MPIQIACPNCGKDYNLADAMNGKNVKCKNCAKVFLVGAVAKTPAPPTKPKGTGTAKAPVARTVAVKTSPRPPVDDEVMDVVAADDDDDPDDDDCPLRKSPKKSAVAEQPAKKSSAMMWIILAGGGAFGFLLLIGCAGGLWWMLSGGAKKVDEEAFNKLRKGMTESEVIAILGSPTNKTNLMGLNAAVWEHGDNKIVVMYDDAGKATGGSGTFRDAKGVTTVLGNFRTDAVAQNPPPPPQNPPPSVPPPGVPPVSVQPQPQPQPPPPPPLPDKKGQSKITQENFNKIKLGMTGQDVNAVLGLATIPHYVTGKQPPLKTPGGLNSNYMEEWHNGKGRLKVWYDKGIGGVVIDMQMSDLPEK